MAGKYKVLGLTTESGNAYLKKIINGSGFEFAGLLELEPRNLDKNPPVRRINVPKKNSFLNNFFIIFKYIR